GHPFCYGANGDSGCNLARGFASHSIRYDVEPDLSLHRFVILSQIQSKHAVFIQLSLQAHVGEMARLQNNRKIQIAKSFSKLGDALKTIAGFLGKRAREKPLEIRKDSSHRV